MQKSFYNFATQAEKARMLQEERRLREEPPAPTTYHAMARHGVDLGLDGGQSQGGYVVGSHPFMDYPGAASPWSGPQPPSEEPLGVALGDAPVVGEPHEVAASIEALAETSPVGSATRAPSPAAPLPASSPDNAVRGDEDNPSEEAHSRLRELMRSSGLVRRTGPQVRRRKV